MVKKFLVLLLAIFVCFCVVGCDNNVSNNGENQNPVVIPNESNNTEYTVHFNTNNGSVKDDVKVLYNSTFDLGENPTNGSLHFMYWTYNGEKINMQKWNIIPSSGTEVTLDAVWGVEYIFDKSVVYDNNNRVLFSQNDLSPIVVMIEYNKTLTEEQFIMPTVLSTEITGNYLYFWKNSNKTYSKVDDLPVATNDMTFTIMAINMDWVSE